MELLRVTHTYSFFEWTSVCFFSVSASALSTFSLVYTSGSACCYFSIPHTVRERALHPGRDKGQGSLWGVTTTLSWKYTCCRPKGRQDNKPLCSFFISVRSHRIIIWSEGKWHTVRRCKCGWARGRRLWKKKSFRWRVIIVEKQLVTEEPFDGCVALQWTHVGRTKKELP